MASDVDAERRARAAAQKLTRSGGWVDGLAMRSEGRELRVSRRMGGREKAKGPSAACASGLGVRVEGEVTMR